MISAVVSATSPTNRSPDTTPALRCFSASPLPTGWRVAASNASRSSSARFMPPASGEITASLSPGAIDLT